jgi:hypothetical protein
MYVDIFILSTFLKFNIEVLKNINNDENFILILTEYLNNQYIYISGRRESGAPIAQHTLCCNSPTLTLISWCGLGVSFLYVNMSVHV